ncbi:nucleotide exchange factor GrpE [Afifella pfennigii]|uniref:nucleotide exchange factor GrpE n=1 Tax=Afifella pfennigii TaxID=209897 RepID=UPI00055330A3|nr:nucleotide exchange factor GrpE [Afifella pfennigii]
MDSEKRNLDSQEAAAEEAKAEERVEPAPDSEEATLGIEELIEKLEAEKADLTERLLRVAAEIENTRRRAARDVQDARRYAISKFAADMLQVEDNLRRALEAVDEKAWGTEDPELKALMEGVQMTARELERILERHEVKLIPAMGERFDPHRHQAMFEVPDDSVPAGTIVQVAQNGYMIGERVLRAAMVGVSRGGPPPEKAPQDEGNGKAQGQEAG